VHVTLAEDGQVNIDEVIEGDTVSQVLRYVQFSAEELMRTMRKRVETALRDKKLTLDESRVLLRFYESGLKGYTYLE
jgi:arginine decarboxylase